MGAMLNAYTSREMTTYYAKCLSKAKGALPEYGLLVYTGPIDSYFAQMGMPKLEYRSIRFEEEYSMHSAEQGP